MDLRRPRVLLLAGCAALAGLTSVPAIAHAGAGQDGPRVAVPGTVPSWATPGAKTGHADDAAIRHVQVALPLRDRQGAEALARAVSTPGSPDYGHHLSSAEFLARFGPTENDVERVTEYLRGQGTRIDGVSANRTVIEVAASVAQLESAFGTTLNTYRYSVPAGVWDATTPRTRSLTAPASPVSLPRELAGTVAAVIGLDDSDLITSPTHTLRPYDSPSATPAVDGTSCAPSWGAVNNASVPQKYPAGRQSNALCGYNTAQLRGIYGLGAANTGAGTTVAIVGAYNLATAEADTNRAAASEGNVPLAPGQYSAVLPPAFGDDPSCDTPDAWNSEQALDLQAVHTLAPGAKLTYYAATTCTTLFDAVNKAVADDTASVINQSFGNPDETSVPPATRTLFGQIAVQAAIQGQTLLVSSGDTGDASGAVGHIAASFPASSPWVTAVGGTTVAVDATGKTTTAGWESSGNTLVNGAWEPQSDKDGPFAGGAGGGHSVLFGTPDYQGRLPAGQTGGKRALPDLSALADVYTGMAVGFTSSSDGYGRSVMGGTSLASPLVAGLVADAAQVQGVDRFGFLNGALYSQTDGLADVVAQQLAVWTPAMVAPGGVTAPTAHADYLVDADTRPQTLQSGPGWDPVAGLGTPTAALLTSLGH